MRYRLLLTLGLTLLFLCFTAALLRAPAAQAANRQDVSGAAAPNVTTTADVSAEDGYCSLREAIGGITGPLYPSTDCSEVGMTIILSPTIYELNALALGGGPLKIQRDLTVAVSGGHATIQAGPGWTRSGISSILYVMSGIVTISDLTIQGGSSGSGGGIFNAGNLSLLNSVIFSNTAQYGGGINNTSIMTVTNSIIMSNTAAAPGTTNFWGGGIYNNNTLTLNNCAVVSNTADTLGGGILNDFSTTLNSVTLSSNTAAVDGGGVYNNGSISLNYATVISNTSPAGVGGAYNGATMTILNTIIAGNGGTGDCGGMVMLSYDYNLSGSGCPYDKAHDRDASTLTLLLGPLQDNGGSTLTHAVREGSPAADWIPFGESGCGDPITTDQRNTRRPQGSKCDIGAFELERASLHIYLPLVKRSN